MVSASSITSPCQVKAVKSVKATGLTRVWLLVQDDTFHFATTSRLMLGSRPPYFPLNIRDSFLWIKWQVLWSCPVYSNYCSGEQCTQLQLHLPSHHEGIVKHRDNFIFPVTVHTSASKHSWRFTYGVKSKCMVASQEWTHHSTCYWVLRALSSLRSIVKEIMQ